MTDKTLLWLSDSPLMPTGYSTVTKEVVNRLVINHGWKADVIAHNYIGQTLPPGVKFLDGDELKFSLWGRGREDYCRDILAHRLQEINPRVFVTLLDTFMMYPFFVNFSFSPASSAFYFPSDGGGGLPLYCDQVLKNFDLPIAMSKFAQAQAVSEGVNASYIPHGADHNLYVPFSDVDKLKAKERFGVAGRFVVGTVARNQGRKMLDRTIKAFSVWCRDKPDAVLLMHTDPLDVAQTFDLNSLVRRYNLQNRVVFTGTRYFKGFDYGLMPSVFNAMDVFLLTTSGEGWGMPTVEAMSCEVPVVVTDYTTTKEIVTDHVAGIAVPVSAEITGSWNVERAVMSIDGCVHALNELYSNPSLRVKFGKNGRAAVLDEYTWDKIAVAFDKVLSGLIKW